MQPVEVKTVAKLGVVSEASRQWAMRPDDQRYLTLPDLHKAVSERRELSREAVVALEHVKIRADSGGSMLAQIGGAQAELTHYAFGQICQRAGAPAGYLRKLPAELAQIPLAWSLENAERDDAKLLYTIPNGHPSSVRALTSPSYGRIWDEEVVKAVMNRCGPEWKIPAASYAAQDPKRATTLYASDRDVFVFLVDDQNAIEVPGEPGHMLFRGFYTWNSEVGDGTFGIATFLYDHVCDNRNIWGVQDFRELKIRHTGGAPDRFLRDAGPYLQNYLQSGTGDVKQAIFDAQRTKVGETVKDVRQWLKDKGFTLSQIANATEYAETVPGDPRSLWNIEQGLTAVARNLTYTNERVELERKAGALMERLAA